MPTLNLGRVRPVHKGTFDSTLTYTVMDRVIYEGNVYECVADAPAGTNPAAESSAYWMPLGISGDNGLTPEPVWDGTKLHFEYPDGTETAEVNLQGPQGIQGPQGPAGQTPPITSDLTSTAEDVALSAKAGKTLKDSVDGVQNAANNAASAADAAQSTADAAAAAAATAATTTALGRARLATTAEVQAGAAAAGSVTPAVLRPEDISTFAPLFTPALKRQVFQVSGSFSDSVARAMHVTLIAGGGSGGNGGDVSYGGLGGRKGGDSSLTIPAGAILNGQILTVSQTVTVKGGAAGCGGGLYAEGGGGEAGAWEEYDIFLPAGLVLSFTIGAGGLPFTTGYSSNANGGLGEGNSTSLTAGGSIGGIPGPGGRQGRNYQSVSSAAEGTQGGCGAGGIKHPLFGGGGPAGLAGAYTYGPRMGAMPGPGAGEAAVKTASDPSAAHYPMAGKGGDGALILEYWNNSVA